MTEQNKYFIAIIPPDPLFSELENFKNQIHQRFNCNGALKSPAHITLHMPFEWPINKLNELQIGLQTFFKEYKNFNVDLGTKSGFEPRVVFLSVLQNTDLMCLQKELCFYVARHFNLFNQRDDRRGFTPHLTIAFRDLKKNDYYQIMSEDWLNTYHASFNCKEIHLLVHKNSKWESHSVFNLRSVM